MQSRPKELFFSYYSFFALTVSWPFFYLLALPSEGRKGMWNQDVSVWDTESYIRPITTSKCLDNSCSPGGVQSHQPYKIHVLTKQQSISAYMSHPSYFSVWLLHWALHQNRGDERIITGGLDARVLETIIC